jgi:hypothetical protein
MGRDAVRVVRENCACDPLGQTVQISHWAQRVNNLLSHRKAGFEIRFFCLDGPAQQIIQNHSLVLMQIHEAHLTGPSELVHA